MRIRNDPYDDLALLHRVPDGFSEGVRRKWGVPLARGMRDR